MVELVQGWNSSDIDTTVMKDESQLRGTVTKRPPQDGDEEPIKWARVKSFGRLRLAVRDRPTSG